MRCVDAAMLVVVVVLSRGGVVKTRGGKVVIASHAQADLVASAGLRVYKTTRAISYGSVRRAELERAIRCGRRPWSWSFALD